MVHQREGDPTIGRRLAVAVTTVSICAFVAAIVVSLIQNDAGGAVLAILGLCLAVFLLAVLIVGPEEKP